MNLLQIILVAATAVLLSGCQTGGRYERSTGQYIDDKATTARVNAALNDNSLLEGADIEVATYRGNVQLTGFVQHPVQKQTATDVVRRVEGVQNFRNDIAVKTQLPTAQGTMNEAAGAGFQPAR